MAQQQEFTVFLASPSAGTLDAREAVAEEVKKINLDPRYAPQVRLKLLRWDDQLWLHQHLLARHRRRPAAGRAVLLGALVRLQQRRRRPG